MIPGQTVRIYDEGFPEGLVINADEYDENIHELFEAEAEEAASGLQAGNGDDSEDEPTLESLMRLTKDELIAKAKKDKKLSYPTPDDVTKATIAQAYLDAK